MIFSSIHFLKMTGLSYTSCLVLVFWNLHTSGWTTFHSHQQFAESFPYPNPHFKMYLFLFVLLVLFFIKLLIGFTYWPTFPLPPFLSFPPPPAFYCPSIHFFFISIQKGADLLWESAKDGISSWGRTKLLLLRFACFLNYRHSDQSEMESQSSLGL